MATSSLVRLLRYRPPPSNPAIAWAVATSRVVRPLRYRLATVRTASALAVSASRVVKPLRYRFWPLNFTSSRAVAASSDFSPFRGRQPGVHDVMDSTRSATVTPGNSAASFLACSGVRRSIWFVSFGSSSASARLGLSHTSDTIRAAARIDASVADFMANLGGKWRERGEERGTGVREFTFVMHAGESHSGGPGESIQTQLTHDSPHPTASPRAIHVRRGSICPAAASSAAIETLWGS